MFLYLVVRYENGLQFSAGVQTVGYGGEVVPAQYNFPQILELTQTRRKVGQFVVAEVEELQQCAPTDKAGDAVDLVTGDVYLV